MELENIVEVYEAHGASAANKYLQSGWRLITVVTASSSGDGRHHPCYIMGRPETVEERPESQSFMAWVS